MAGLLIIAHAPLASALKAVAAHVYGEALGHVAALDVERDADVLDAMNKARRMLAALDQKEVLLMVDAVGATPYNVALPLVDGVAVRMVTGVNVPMLWRSLCYLGEPLEALVSRAMSGAMQGITQCGAARPAIQGTKFHCDEQIDRRHRQ